MATQTVPQTKFCTACGNQIHMMAEICPVCGVRQMAAPVQPYGYVPAPPRKDKTVAALLAIFLGGIGIHKFYLGKIGQGILYILLCWTFLPALAGFIEGIMYLVQSEQSFQASLGGQYRTGQFSA
ncbi:MAG TPA: TM2 domain-containing protein [Longimicrobiaceae bacterium]